jgi:hypothetical protein
MRRIVVLLAATTLLAGCAQHSTSTTPVGTAPAPAGRDPRSITIREVERILAQARLPDGARAATAHEAAGKELQTYPNDKNLVDRHGTYVIPLGYQDAISWFDDHPPPHLQSAGTSSVSGPEGLISAGLEFEGHATLAYDSLAEQVAVYPIDDTHAVVRVDGLAVWLPRRSDDERVPPGATAVHVARVVQGGANPQRFTLNGSAVHRLAHVVNTQRPTSNGIVNCPNDNGAYDVLHFTGSTPDPVFRVDASGCGFINVTNDGVTQPALSGGYAVDRVLRKVLICRG